MIFIKGKEKLLGLLRTCHTAGRFNSGHVHHTPKGEYIRLGMKKPGENDQHKTGSRKDGTVPAEGQPPE